MSATETNRRLAKTGLVAAALVGSLLTFALPATAAPDGIQTFHPNAVTDVRGTNCGHPQLSADGTWWEEYCDVYSGQLRTITYCADGTTRIGDWVGPGHWRLYGYCYESGSTVAGVAYQKIG